MPVSITIKTGKHSHPVPPGMYPLLRELVTIAKLGKDRVFKQGPSVKGTGHLRGVTGVRLTDKNTVELRCLPGDNKSSRIMWLVLKPGENGKDVETKLTYAAVLIDPKSKEAYRKGAKPKLSFREELARAVPERDATMDDQKSTENTAGTSAGELEEKQKKWARTPADDPSWVKKAVEVFLAATSGQKMIKAELFGKVLIDGLQLDVSLETFRGTIVALVNRGYWRRVHFKNDPTKHVSHYEITEKGLALVGIEQKQDETNKKRLDKLAELEKSAATIVMLEQKLTLELDAIAALKAKIDLHEEEVGRIKAEIASQPEEAKKARELLKLLE